jgi:hypothetical protein
MKIRCTTLFDITRTNVNTRREIRSPDPSVVHALNRQRNQQMNFETVLQVINMRAQPENITDPTVQKINIDQFGTDYRSKRGVKSQVWVFEFQINHESAFQLADNQLGSLIQDCNSVPMITGLDESANLPTHLSTSTDDCNILFEIVDATTEHY